MLVQGQVHVNRNFQLVLDEMGPCRTSQAWYFHSPEQCYMPHVTIYKITACLLKMIVKEFTVLPAKSDSDVMFCLQLYKQNINLYTPSKLIS